MVTYFIHELQKHTIICKKRRSKSMNGEKDLVTVLRRGFVGFGMDVEEHSPSITYNLNGSAWFLVFEKVLHRIAAQKFGNELLQTHGRTVPLHGFLLLHGDRHLFPLKRNVCVSGD